MATVLERLIEMLAAKFGGSPEPKDGLAFLGADSIGMAELTLDLEEQFQIQLTDELSDLETVQDLADYIERLQSEKQNS